MKIPSLKNIVVAIGLLCLGASGLAVAQGTFAGGITGTASQADRQIFQVGILRITRETAITAFSGGGQTNAYQLTYGLNRVSTVAAGNDSVKLPTCIGGKVVVVINAAASNSLNVYGQTGETINALSANSAFALVANKSVIFFCANDGNWYGNLTAFNDNWPRFVLRAVA